VPLRSVEAATRDDAIAAAREQFGPSARVVGVRRVRSGGVLGFFATERYVAEVADGQPGRPDVPAPAPAAGRPSSGGRSALTSTGGFGSSPLSAAAPATAAPSSAMTGRAPARNGAAAWAAAAGAGTPEPAAGPAAQAWSSSPAWSPTPARAAAPAQPVEAPADEDRLSELAGLLGAEPAGRSASVYGRTSFPRASFPRASRDVSASLLDDEDDDVPSEPVLPEAPASAPPSPFTAALARMVSGDRDVRHAVEQVLEQPMVLRSRGDAEAWPSWSGSLHTEDTSVPLRGTRQEEETVGDQVIAPPSTHATRTTGLPNWAVEPEPAAAGSSREEAIAEVLRSALAQGHSDEALAGILRKVLAGASPQTALTEPETPASEPVVAPPVTMSLAMALAGAGIPAPAPVVEDIAPPVEVTFETAAVESPVVETAAVEAATEAPAFEAPAFEAAAFEEPPSEEPAFEAAGVDEPAFEEPAFEEPAFEEPSFEVFAVEAPAVEESRVEAPADETPVVDTSLFQVSDVTPMAAAPLPLPSVAVPAPASSIWGTSADSIWGAPASHSTLWGEPVASWSAPATPADAPIWAEIVRHEPVVAEAAAEIEPDLDVELAAPALEASDVAEPEAVAEVAEVAEAVEIEEPEADVEVAELAPVLARTASDPAPMSLDATTVMPPLSLLPPLPGSRGGRGGRPPVPPSSTRAPVTATRPSAPPVSSTPAAPVGTPSVPADDAATAEVPVASPLATVTRLPVAPLMATAETPQMPGLFDDVEDDEPVAAVQPAAPAAVEVPAGVEIPALTEPARTTAPAVAPSTPGTVGARLEVLGVPASLLGATFATDVETHGTYAALTRALGLRLPKAPELPTGAGEVLVVVGPGVETLRAARSLAAMLRLDPDSVQWATRGDLAGLAPKGSRVTTVDAAIDRRQAVATAGTVTIVAVDAPMRTDAYWTAQMMAVWAPVAVWAVVEATRKPEDLMPWIDGLPRVDALIVQDTDLSADPAAVLRRVAAPVAILDGVRATPHRWASLLCERLENGQA
jgi:hypothetical protein